MSCHFPSMLAGFGGVSLDRVSQAAFFFFGSCYKSAQALQKAPQCPTSPAHSEDRYVPPSVFGEQEPTAAETGGLFPTPLPHVARVTRKGMVKEGRVGPGWLRWGTNPAVGTALGGSTRDILHGWRANRRPHLVSSSTLLSALIGLAVITV